MNNRCDNINDNRKKGNEDGFEMIIGNSKSKTNNKIQDNEAKI